MKIPVVLTIACLFFGLPVFGQWHLIDDFQQWSDGDFLLKASDIGWHASQARDTDEYWMLNDPHDSENTALLIEPGGYGLTPKVNLFVMKELPGNGIPPGESGTLFFRSLWSGYNNIWNIGTAYKQLAYDPQSGGQIEPGAFGDFNALFRLDRNNVIEHRDGDGYVPTSPEIMVEVNLWYNFWMVVENTWDTSVSPATSTGVYTLYLEGPDDDAPALVSVGIDPAKDKASFRRAPVDADGNPQSIIWIMFATSPDPIGNGSPFLLDDFYFSQGMDLTNPQVPPCENCPDANGNLDTGEWMGWINVTQAPYLWVYAVEGWLYMEEPSADSPGAWGYFYK